MQRLDRVIDDLLAYARAGATSSEAVPVERQALIDGIPRWKISAAAAGVSRARARRRQTLRDQPDAAGKWCCAIWSTMPSSITISPPAPSTSGWRTSAEHCVFTVADDGPGIPPANHERVFRMFQTLAPSNRDHSGIGLALSKRLVESHGGWIKIRFAGRRTRHRFSCLVAALSVGERTMTKPAAFSLLLRRRRRCRGRGCGARIAQAFDGMPHRHRRRRQDRVANTSRHA